MTNKQTSYPRSKIKILLLENISESAIEEFKESGYVEIKGISGALSEADLVREIKGVHILGVRSKTQITEKIIEKADRLLAIGAFCIGINQINLRAATERGVAVFNAPYSNTRSVAELVIGLCVMLIRRITDKNIAAHGGVWLKDASGSFELRGKTLGIIGYGNIGSQVSVMAEALGMNVIYYDVLTKLPHGNAKQERDLRALLKKSNIVTLHVPSDATTRNMINEETLGFLPKGSIFLNYSRGDVVDLEALKKYIENGTIGGAAVDVFPEEPERNGDSFQSVLQNLPNVILTPHIGGSTEEAQANIGLDVTAKLINYLELGTSTGSHTVPDLNLPPQAGTHRILHIHRNVPGVLGEINSKLSSRNINIVSQYLKTNDEIGYVILDIDTELSKEAFAILKEVNATIKTRMVY
jgi:D-3-phosphoglycerate dehydrogenase